MWVEGGGPYAGGERIPLDLLWSSPIGLGGCLAPLTSGKKDPLPKEGAVASRGYASPR